MRTPILVTGVTLVVAACSNNDSANNTMNVDENLTTTDMNATSTENPIVPDHNYDIREGYAYGYTAAVSEEDQKKGKAAGDVVMFKYVGLRDGVQRLLILGNNGEVTGTAECAVPCVAIKEIFSNGEVSRFGYTEHSVIGAAFQDAIRGKLEIAHSKRIRAPRSAVNSANENNTMNVDENLTTTDAEATTSTN